MSNCMNAPMDGSGDDTLVERARHGNGEAFAELARRHRERIYALMIRMTRNHCDADDLTQEAFLTAYRGLGSFNGRSSFYTWLYRIAVNLSLNHLKKRGRDKGSVSFDERLFGGNEPRSPGSSPEETSVRVELGERLERAIDGLPDLFKATFLLVTRQGLSHAEAAAVLGCTEKTISWRMHKARKKLRASLAPFAGGGGA